MRLRRDRSHGLLSRFRSGALGLAATVTTHDARLRNRVSLDYKLRQFLNKAHLDLSTRPLVVADHVR